MSSKKDSQQAGKGTQAAQGAHEDAPRSSPAEVLPAGGILVDAVVLKRKAYKFTYTTGPFSLPLSTLLNRLGGSEQ